uniref:mannose-1-phosphate guanylyltransferase n=1 Tax=Arcella intermedia TaxID=1963864 RepID=A0A6B2L7L4_9EUKA|eukprot:TRINITY_DN1940_c0_g1_i1.p1 TRINITY_DN1940_c0_g1~~TRINITY_DN1940_c0_g1_i1.p1  ORF type:complete len:366 (+),score=67.83 TRINITY_DN1940_c0_g1_i1:78-1175(+)
MKALILVGGFGTRLRPLTLTIPKPCVPFCNKEMVVHQIEGLKRAGVDTIILAVNYKPELMTAILKPWESKLGVKIVYSQELEPLGTAGPLALARDVLMQGDEKEPFFVLNSDITSEFPFDDLLKFHKAHGKEGTIMVTQVSEPSKYGVVVYNEETGSISRFVEKPQTFVGNKINAGMYIFNKSILGRIPLQPTSIETDIFPKMAQDGQLCAMELKGFWMDVGQPKDYLAGMCKYLTSLQDPGNPNAASLTKGKGIIEPVMIDPNAKIGKDCLIGPFVTIGPGVTIEDGVRLRRTSILEGAMVQRNTWIDESIVGWESRVGKWVRMEGFSVLGRDVRIADELYINGAMILDHKAIKDTVPEPTIIM